MISFLTPVVQDQWCKVNPKRASWTCSPLPIGQRKTESNQIKYSTNQNCRPRLWLSAVRPSLHFSLILRYRLFNNFLRFPLTCTAFGFWLNSLWGASVIHSSHHFLSRYFSLQATNPLGFGDSVRMEIESNICREGGPLPDCFTTPLRQAWTTMEKVRVSDSSTPSTRQCCYVSS